MNNAVFLVCVVDDDQSIRESLPGLLKSVGFATKAFSSAEEFLGSADLPRTDCLILDVRMPGMSGPELQRELKVRGLSIPIVFITAHADESLRPRALRAGAVDCLLKPFGEEALFQAIHKALHQ